MTLRELIDSDPENAKRTDDEVMSWSREDVDRLVPLDSRKLLRWGGAGNLVAKNVRGAQVTIPVVAGQIVPIKATHVMAATTATGLTALV